MLKVWLKSNKYFPKYKYCYLILRKRTLNENMEDIRKKCFNYEMPIEILQLANNAWQIKLISFVMHIKM